MSASERKVAATTTKMGFISISGHQECCVFFSLIHASLRCELFRACGVWTVCVAMDEMRARGTQHNGNNVVGRTHCDIWRFVRRSTSIHNLRGESQENKLCMHNRSKRKTSRSNARRKKKKGSHAKDKRNKNLTTKIQTILGPIYIFVRVLESFFFICPWI